MTSLLSRFPPRLLSVLAAGLLFPAPGPAVPASETQILLLSGTGKDDAVPWEFFCTGGRHSGAWTKIPVPSCWELQGFGTYDYGVWHRNDGGNPHPPPLPDEQGRYRREFTAPAEWSGRVVRLVFEGVMTDAEVRVNGEPAGPVHQGAFYRFSYDITPLVRPGAANLLEVTVSKVSANESVNRAERLGDYWNFGGIFRPVWLEALPAQFIDRTAIDARADGSFSAQVHLGSALPAGTTAHVTAEILDANDQSTGAVFSAPVDLHAEAAVIRGRVRQPKLWTAETPHLYRVRFRLLEPWNGPVEPTASRARTTVLHTVTERFGFRTFEVRPRDGLYLNGKKIILKGANRHSFWPDSGRTLSRQVGYDDARLMKEMNMNAVRMSHYPPDPDFLEACDELGLYVLDELAGWQGFYDLPTGTRLVGEMVRRDVNHPSILFWDNGNEGGWNTAIDGEFAKWDPQQRSVLHPWETFNHVNTTHYKDYARAVQLCAGPEIYLPTEFNHGLYDGGAGAGLWDRWERMRKSPLCAGGFIWALVDEGVVRTDENGRIDCAGNLAPDGIVGPHREKEGSFNTIRELWSPVAITASGESSALPAGWNGELAVENRYDFTNLDQCTFEWSLARFAGPREAKTGHEVIASGKTAGPSVGPHSAGEAKLLLPDSWRQADALFVTARDPAGHELWTWSWPLQEKPTEAAGVNRPEAGAKVHDEDGDLVVAAGPTELRFSRSTGRLAAVRQLGRAISLGNGPRFLAYRSKDRDFEDVAQPGSLGGLTARIDDGGNAVVEVNYSGPLSQVRWRIAPDGQAQLDYTYSYDGTVDLLGVQFDYPEEMMKGIRWLGWGPYRVWQNRMQGTRLDVWSNAANDTTPGESWSYPEFKGYFRGWRWAGFETMSEGSIMVTNETRAGFLGVYTPKDGKVGPVLHLPATGLAFLEVIPPIGSKFTLAGVLGPESQSRQMSGVHHGAICFRFGAP
jgi:hypothetical protein